MIIGVDLVGGIEKEGKKKTFCTVHVFLCFFGKLFWIVLGIYMCMHALIISTII